MILTAYSLLVQNPRPTIEQITEAMNENLCRCGSYQRIIQAIQDAVGEMKGGPVL
jgi:aerobic-type carbon monoxide dehydrogenase small subunit (CoxS/CutS family)